MHGSKEDKALLAMLPVVVMWIRKDTDLTEQELRTVAKAHPNEFDFAQRTPTTDMMALMERYRGNKIYRELIDVVLSDKGWKWVERTVEKCRKMPPMEGGNGSISPPKKP